MSIANMLVLQDVLKTSSEDEDERRLQDVFIKTNVCWDICNSHIGWVGFLEVQPLCITPL